MQPKKHTRRTAGPRCFCGREALHSLFEYLKGCDVFPSDVLEVLCSVAGGAKDLHTFHCADLFALLGAWGVCGINSNRTNQQRGIGDYYSERIV